MMHPDNNPVWRLPKFVTGKIIIVLDKQKPRETVAEYRDRVVELFRSRRMSVHHDQRIMCRIFLGGLRPQILDILLQTEQLFHFKSVSIHAEVLERLQLAEEMYIKETGATLVRFGNEANAAAEAEAVAVPGPGEVAAPGPGEVAAADAGAAAAEERSRGWGGRGPPTFIQDGELYYGEPNHKIDELYRAKYILVLYR